MLAQGRRLRRTLGENASLIRTPKGYYMDLIGGDVEPLWGSDSFLVHTQGAPKTATLG
jgi:hypothetical protein